MVRLPPSSVLRAAPKNFFGLMSALESTPPDMVRPLLPLQVVVAAGEAGDGVEQDDHVPAELDEALGAVADDLGQLRVALRAFVESGAVDFAIHRALEIGHFLRALIDKQQDEVASRAN